MLHISKFKKILTIIPAIMITVSAVNFKEFAMVNNINLPIRQPIGASENQIINCNKTSSKPLKDDLTLEQKTEDILDCDETCVTPNESQLDYQQNSTLNCSNIIHLYQPGDYVFVGRDLLEDPSPGEILIASDNQILISGSGDYNITLKNVNIDIDGSALICNSDSEINLQLDGQNNLISHDDVGIDMRNGGSLIITSLDEDSSLNISGTNGIHCSRLIIEDGNLNVTAREPNIYMEEDNNNQKYQNNSREDFEYNGIVCETMEMIDGNITVEGSDNGIFCTNDNTYIDSMIIYDGNIKIKSKCGISSDSGDIIINGGTIIISFTDDCCDPEIDCRGIDSNYGDIIIHAGNIMINIDNIQTVAEGLTSYMGNIIIYDGDVTISGIASGIYADGGDIFIHSGHIKTNCNSHGIYNECEEGKITINGGDIEARGSIGGIYTDDGDITINGGNIKACGGIHSDGAKVIIENGKIETSTYNKGHNDCIYGSGKIIINGGNIRTNKIYCEMDDSYEGGLDGIIAIYGGNINTHSIESNNVIIIDGNVITRYINGELWNSTNISRLNEVNIGEEIFGKYEPIFNEKTGKTEDTLIACSKNKVDDTYNTIGYLITTMDSDGKTVLEKSMVATPLAYELTYSNTQRLIRSNSNNLYLHISGGTINGMLYGSSGLHTVKFNTFPGHSLGTEFSDVTLLTGSNSKKRSRDNFQNSELLIDNPSASKKRHIEK